MVPVPAIGSAAAHAGDAAWLHSVLLLLPARLQEVR